MSNFSFSQSVYYLFGELSNILIKYEIVSCKVFQFGRVESLSFGKGLIVVCEGFQTGQKSKFCLLVKSQ